jgi:uncharacterized hydrophobic protein (TIGR00341 family)
LIEIFLPNDPGSHFETMMKDHRVLGLWKDKLADEHVLIRMLVPVEETGKMLDLLEKRFSSVDGFRSVLLPVEATIPRPKPAQEESKDPAKTSQKKTEKAKPVKISREELYSDIEETTRTSWVFVAMVVLSSIVAAVGILRDNVAIIIGAMVIAPLLGPNVALSLATTLGDVELARRSIRANGVGIFTAFVFAALVGMLLNVDPSSPEIALRTYVGVGDIVLALAAGGAGTLAFTAGASSAVIGVMVAVALLPPLVTFGLLFGARLWYDALGAMLLFLVNIICINLAGVVSFLVQGIRPINWWEADRAKKATRNAIAVWSVLLLLLVIMIVVSQKT